MQNALMKHIDEQPLVPAPSAEKLSIQAQIEIFKRFEQQCDEATEELEALAKDVTYRVSQAESAEDKTSEVDLDNEFFFGWKADITPTEVDQKSFRRRAELARKFCVPYRVSAGFNFVEGAMEAELEELETLDLRIRLLQYQMDQTEAEIIEMVPTSAAEAIAKLKFVSGLLINGCHLDVDHFAFIVQEAANQCSKDLSRLQHTMKRQAELSA